MLKMFLSAPAAAWLVAGGPFHEIGADPNVLACSRDVPGADRRTAGGA